MSFNDRVGNIGALSLSSFLFYLLSVASFDVIGQSWQEMMADPNQNLYDIREAYEQQIGDQKLLPHSGSKQFERWFYWQQFKTDEQGNIRHTKDIYEEAQKFLSNNAARSQAGNWEELGPMYESNIYRGVGRLNCIAFHPTDPNKVMVGSPSGGVWISKDKGETWQNPDETLINFGVSSIAYDPNNPNIIYIGTGDVDGSESYGVGVWKSTDGGQSWSPSNTDIEDIAVGVVKIRPDSTNIILAGTQEGIYRSEDAGQSWTFTSVVRDFRDIEFKPDNPMIVYAADYNYWGGSLIYKSVDGGKNWARRFIFEGLYPEQRYEIEVSAAAPDRVYGMSRSRFVVSYDAADTFNIVIDSGEALIERQGWYNASFEVSQDDPDLMWSGHVYLYRSSDAGKVWQRVSGSHADNHFLAINPHDGSLWVADDGGIHVSDDEGRNYRDLTMMGIGAIYGISQSQFSPDDLLSGYQDCGSKLYNGHDFASVYGADGMVPLFDWSDSNKYYTSWQYGGVVRHQKGYGNGSGNLKMPEDEGAWVTPYILDGRTDTVMYIGRERIWKSSNIYTEKTKNVVWESISSGLAVNPGGSFVQLQLARTNNQVMYAIWRRSNSTRLIKCDDIYDSSPVWSDVTASLNVSSFSPDFETDPFDSLKIYLLRNNGMLITEDGGASWKNVSTGLPDVPNYCLELDTATGDMYLGSDLGVFYLAAGDTVWETFSNGLSKNARVEDLKIYYSADPDKRRLKAATYGRGIWESDLYSNSARSFPKAPQVYMNHYPERPFHLKHTYDQSFELELEFRRNLKRADVSDLTMSDFVVTNGQVTGLTGSLGHYFVTVEADTFGKVSVELPAGTAAGVSDGLASANEVSAEIIYVDHPAQMGYEGPAGVGSKDELRFWLRSDDGIHSDSLTAAQNDHDTVNFWFDRSGHGLYAKAGNADTNKPHLVLDSNGVGGWPAVEFLPVRRYLLMNNVTDVGENLSAFCIAQSNTENWHSSGWIANARTQNGFVLHVNKDGKSMRSEVTSNKGQLQYAGAESQYAHDIRIPHIYGSHYNQTERKHYSILDDKKRFDELPSGFEDRVADDTIFVRMGIDNWDREGNGKVAELFYFNQDVYDAKRIIITNYLSARYGIKLEFEDKYDFDVSHPWEMAGIGRMFDYDYHADAKGEGPLRLKAPQDMEDNEFLMWGHDNEALDSWIDTNTPYDGFYKRVSRTWRVTESGGDLGNIDVLLDSSAVPSSSDPIGLAFSPSSDFSEGYYSIPLTLNADGKYEGNGNFNDGDWFTIITAPKIEVGQYEGPRELFKANLYPNPSGDGQSTLSLELFKDAKTELSLRDIKGSIIWSKELQLNEGFQEIPVSMSSEASGVYLLSIDSQDFSRVLKWVVE